MTKKTTLLIIFLFLVTCGLLYLAITMTPSSKKIVITPPTPTLTPLPENAQTTLSLVSIPATPSSKLGKYTVGVVVDTKNDVTAVQMELQYDPRKIFNLSLTPGDFFIKPTILLQHIDLANGRISYALAGQPGILGKSDKANVAVLSFTLAPGTVSKETTTINFLPKSAVTAEGIAESVLKTTNDITLYLPSTISATLSPAGR